MSLLGTSPTSRRLVAYTVAASSLLALVATAVQLYSDYRIEVSSIEEDLALVERSNAAGLSHGLWIGDDELLDAQLEGVMRLPRVTWIRVDEVDGVPKERGRRPRGQRIETAFDVTHAHRGKVQTLAHVSVAADLSPVVDRLTSRLLVILATNAGKTLLVALLMLVIFRRLFTRHLNALAKHVRSLEPDASSAPLELRRAPLSMPDELQLVVQAVNGMVDDVRNGFESRDALESALRLRVRDLEEFSYSLSHDLKAPLRTIQNFSEMLSEMWEETPDSEAADFLQRIENAAARMSRLVESMLELSVVAHGELDLEEVDLGELTREIFEELQLLSVERPARLVLAEDLRVNADRTLVRTLLENLIGNAWTHTRECVEARIELGVEASAEGARFFVADNGGGFDPKLVEKVFQPFQSAHARREGGGSGIGLSIVLRVAERHGGRAWAHTRPGEGTRMYFTLQPPTKPNTGPVALLARP